MQQRKGASVSNSNAKPQVTRSDAPASTKAPRIMVTESNRSVENQVEAAGGKVVKPSYLIDSAVRDLATCDGLLITGGGDVNPELYGQRKHPQVYGLTPTRDLRELALLGAARTLGIPVLGICRGMQIIAVEAGGTLLQHVPDRVRHQEHGCSMMPVRTVRGSLVARTLGERPDMLHLHHQAVKRIPDGFQVTARHGDGIVEAIESNDGRVVGVQFHPESVLTNSKAPHYGWKLFDAFVDSCTRYRRRVKRNGRPDLLDPVSTYKNAWPVAVEAYESMTRYSNSNNWSSKVVTSTPKSGPKSAPAQLVKSDDGKVVELGPKPKTTAAGKALVVLDTPVAWCGPCGVAFDFINDYVDHVDFFHPGTSLDPDLYGWTS